MSVTDWKPVHRRIIYSMFENGYDYNRPFRKTARIVGEHCSVNITRTGDSSVYEAMVRMDQPFSIARAAGRRSG